MSDSWWHGIWNSTKMIEASRFEWVLFIRNSETFNDCLVLITFSELLTGDPWEFRTLMNTGESSSWGWIYKEGGGRKNQQQNSLLNAHGALRRSPVQPIFSLDNWLFLWAHCRFSYALVWSWRQGKNSQWWKIEYPFESSEIVSTQEKWSHCLPLPSMLNKAHWLYEKDHLHLYNCHSSPRIKQMSISRLPQDFV